MVILETAVDPQVATDVVAIMEAMVTLKVATAMLAVVVATMEAMLTLRVAISMLAVVVATVVLLLVMVATIMARLVEAEEEMLVLEVVMAATMAIQETVVAIEVTMAIVVPFSRLSHPQRNMVLLAKKIRYRPFQENSLFKAFLVVQLPLD